MISIDDHPPPDPSSSYYQKHQQHDLKIDSGNKSPVSVSDIDLLKPTDDNHDDTNNRLPSFSIRDYVFGARCKDITCNWPFSDDSLQLCLDSGMKNFLPPFQSLDSLRSINSSVSNEETMTSFNGKSKVDPLVSQLHVKENFAQKKPKKSYPAASSQPAVKKCKFAMKSNSSIEPLEDFTPNNFIVSETMASKVCPVCKTFSSSSNTTLNAHIDRCLSEESSMKWTANSKISVKHKIKPRKMRSMVDIYKTAPRCTVEELDRRNGTSWATNSNFHDQELEAEEEKEEPQEPTFTSKVVGHEGDVYIDTNGTKVRILSMPKVNTLDDHEARKVKKLGKGSKSVMEKKKKEVHVQKRCVKFLKLGPNSKKLSSLKPHHGASEARSGQEENVGIERSCEKEDRGETPIKATVHKQMDDLAITRPPWACSKRTGLAKKFNDKSFDDMSSSQHSKKARTQLSNGSKFSYLKMNLSSKTREHNSVTKFNLKRKFSALKESQENGGSSQDSLKQKSRMGEEDTSKNSSFDTVNVLEVNTKNSMTSRSSDGDSLESARTEIPSHSNHVEGSFKGLKNAMMDDEFSKLVSQPDNKFDLRESMENIMIDDHNIEDQMDNIEKQGNYFQEFDPVPIPGPPGSFLPPSPGVDMVSEELQGNSSLTTTSRVQSSEDQLHHHDMINREFMSESPISTISSPSFARSGHSKPDDKLSVGFTSLQDTNLGYPSVKVDNKYAPMASSVDTEKSSTPSVFQNDQPCCCSRKEGVFSKTLASYPQESAALRENRRPSTMNLSSELFSLINCSTLPPPSETVKSPADASIKFPVYRDCESAVSPSTPVLRLMGKNLTVVKTDDEQFRPPPRSSDQMRSHQQLHNIQNEQNSFFYGYPSHQHPMIFNHNQNGSKPQHLNVHPPYNSRDSAHSRQFHAFDTMFTSTRNGFMAPADYHRPDTTIACDRNNEIINFDVSSENKADDSYAAAGVSPDFRNGTLDGNLGRWGCTQTGSSSILHPNSLGSQSAFIPNMRSTSYYPRSFS